MVSPRIPHVECLMRGTSAATRLARLRNRRERYAQRKRQEIERKKAADRAWGKTSGTVYIMRDGWIPEHFVGFSTRDEFYAACAEADRLVASYSRMYQHTFTRVVQYDAVPGKDDLPAALRERCRALGF